VGVAVGVALGTGVGVAVGGGVSVGVAGGNGVRVGVAVGRAVRVGVGTVAVVRIDRVGAVVGVSLALARDVAVGGGVAVGDGVAVGCGVAVGVAVAVGSGVDVGEGVAVGSGVGVGDGVAVGSGVGVGDGVGTVVPGWASATCTVVPGAMAVVSGAVTGVVVTVLVVVMGKVAVTTPVITWPLVIGIVSVMVRASSFSNRASTSGSSSTGGTWVTDSASSMPGSSRTTPRAGETVRSSPGTRVGVAISGNMASSTSSARFNGSRVIPRMAITATNAARMIVRRGGRRAGFSSCPHWGHTESDALAFFPHCRQRMLGATLG
jgi:hypothetical protein